MKYQIVLQWSASSIKGFNTFLEVEELLIERLKAPDYVDGHDAGQGEINIFILSENPADTFNDIKTILGGHPLWSGIRVACRRDDKSGYEILWPKDLTDFRIA
jgi:hypothetical protein